MSSALHAILIAAAVFLLSACVSRDSTYHPYSNTNGLIREGMTRRQVYAVARPARTPMASPPTLTSMMGIAFYSYHSELHELPHGWSMTILYRRANANEYPSTALFPGTVEEMIKGDYSTQLPVRSAENMGDIVHRVSALRRSGTGTLESSNEPKRRIRTAINLNETTGTYDQVFLNPPSNAKSSDLPSLKHLNRR